LSLDVVTLTFVLFLTYSANSLISAMMAWSGRSFRGAWLWVGGQALLATGALFIFFRDAMPLWVSVIGGNTSYVAACLVFAHAVWVFRFSRPFPRVSYLIFLLVPLSLIFVAGQPFVVRTLASSLWVGVGTLFVGGLLVWRMEPQFRLANSTTALPFLAVGLASLVRLVLNFIEATPQDFHHQASYNLWYLLGANFISPVTLLGYFMMTGIRLEQTLHRKDVEIESRNRQLLESARAKDLFFSLVAHDLRGPIGGAARFARKHLLGKMTGLEAKHLEVETLTSSLEKTQEFLEKLLWWSKAQLLDWVPALRPIDLAASFDQAVQLVLPLAEPKEVALVVEPGPYPKPVADPESVQLILVNLLTNAVKFSVPRSAVRLSACQDGELCRVSVADQGVGMDQETVGRLFRIEDKLTTSGTSGESGSGIGLILAKSLAERNQGAITLESQPEIGTTVHLWLSMRNPERPG
jgi:signal transduction histidine kinase